MINVPEQFTVEQGVLPSIEQAQSLERALERLDKVGVEWDARATRFRKKAQLALSRWYQLNEQRREALAREELRVQAQARAWERVAALQQAAERQKARKLRAAVQARAWERVAALKRAAERQQSSGR